MHRRDCPIPDIGDQNRETIRRTDGERDTWLVRDRRIAFTQVSGAIGDENSIGMSLAQRGDFGWVKPLSARSRSEAVFQPAEFFERLRAIDSGAVQVKQILF